MININNYPLKKFPDEDLESGQADLQCTLIVYKKFIDKFADEIDDRQINSHETFNDLYEKKILGAIVNIIAIVNTIKNESFCFGEIKREYFRKEASMD